MTDPHHSTSDWICETCGARVELDDVGRPLAHWREPEDPSTATLATRCPTSGARRIRDVISRTPDSRPTQMRRPGDGADGPDGQGKLFE